MASIINRKIDDGQDLIFWDPPGSGPDGYAISTAACDNPDCTCTRMWIGVHPTMLLEDGMAEVQVPVLRGEVSADGDDLVFDDEAGPTDVPTEWLREHLSAPRYRQWFQERWRRLRGQIGDPNYPAGEAPAFIDGLVSFSEVFPWDFDLTVVYEGETYLIEDQYCLEPTCPCEEVVIQFINGARASVGENNGHARASVGRLGSPDCSSSLVRRLWTTMLDQHDRRDLVDRYDRMRKVAARRRPKPVVHETKTGRNEPCPCGSGKKYKRCCGSGSAAI